MSGLGTRVEVKPRWREIPIAVRNSVEELLGARVARAARVWGGYAPTPTFRLKLDDGRRAFIKGTHPELVEGAQRAIAREKRVYEELGELIAGWAPVFHGSIEVDGWKILALEDLGPKSVPPWNRGLEAKILTEYASFHRSTVDREIPQWVPRPEAWLSRHAMSWDWIEEPRAVESVANLAASNSSKAARWIETNGERLTETTKVLADPALPRAFLHFDTRSDNLRWVSGRLYLLDWPHVGVGPMEIDVVAFAQSITVEGGGEPETLLALYERHLPLASPAVDAAAAALAGFFAYQSGQPDIPELPRLRKFQRQQLKVTLNWAARRLGLPAPEWTEYLDV